MRIYVETYGCTLNQADSDIMKALLADEHILVEDGDSADVIVINTCTVKGPTENKILSRIGELQSRHKKLVVAGCMSADVSRLRKFTSAPIVGTSALAHINDAILDAVNEQSSVYLKPTNKDLLPKMLTRPIARIPINDGCLSSCYFCQTKIARPFLRSYSPKNVAKWINEAVRQGAREIQLTSMDSGAYGRDIRTDLVSLLNALAHDDSSDNTGAKYWIRLGMINPQHVVPIVDDLIEVLKTERFYQFIHIPVQSGSEKVCREMNRGHTVEDFVSLVKEFRSKLPDINIATDIIVGYPTETEEDFQETVNLLTTVKPDVTNVSKFSPRPGTKAKEMKQLPSEVVKARSRKISELVKQIHAERRARFVGRTQEVLVTESKKGRNKSYFQVVFEEDVEKGRFVRTYIKSFSHTSLFGVLK